MKKNKEKLKQKISDYEKVDLYFYLVGLRLFPGSPNWLMNITFPYLGINSLIFCSSVFIGIAPWNFITASAGDMIGTLTSTKEIMTTEKYIIVS